MIDLTPLEVRKKKADFRKGLRGYETQEVDDFLDLVAERLEDVVRENANLRERVASLTESVNGFRTREQAMNEALVSAQELREEIREQAQRQAELALKDSRTESDRIIDAARREAQKLESGTEHLRANRDRFLRSYRNFLEAQLEELGREEERILRARTGEWPAPEEGEQ